MKFESMSLEQMVAQIFVVSFRGAQITSAYRDHFVKNNFANFIYFADNLKDYKSIRKLSDELQMIAKEICGVPAFICVDQEGGMVTRAHSGATVFPSSMALAAASMPDKMETVGKIVGAELRALGMNINHAPVLDVNNNAGNPVIGIRSYSDDPAVVTAMGCDYLKGLQSSKCMASIKHFPGHGDTNLDSHTDLPCINHDLDRLNKIELVPFKAAIKAGADSVMTAHIIFKAIDDLPATLSKKILTGFLREELGFEGLIITDSMSMKAIETHYTTEKGCIMAINAGVDLLCMACDFETQQSSYEAVLEAVKNGEIPEARIHDAVERIAKYKAKYNLTFGDEPQPEQSYAAHETLADEFSKKSITLVKDNPKLLPLTDKRIYAISTLPINANLADDELKVQAVFAKKLGESIKCPFEIIDVNPTSEDIEAICRNVGDSEIVVFGTYNAILNPGQSNLFDALKKKGKSVILVALRVPYDIALLNSADAAVATYGYTNRSVKHVVEFLTGKLNAAGKLPISL